MHTQSSVLGRQIEAVLCPGMTVPHALEQLFVWIERNGHFIDKDGRRIGFLFPEREMKESRTKIGRLGGTDIEFAAEGNINLKYWFRSEEPNILQRLCVFAQTGGDGSMAAFWLADDGSQKIVHLGSGSGSITVCVLADEAIDFLRLLAIGYDEICWGDEFATPPGNGGTYSVQDNHAFRDWVCSTFAVGIPDRGSDVVRHHATMMSKESDDPFWQWVRRYTDWTGN